MMLRESIEIEGGAVDLRAITDGRAASASAIPGAEALVGFVEATLNEDEAGIAKARDHVREILGAPALVDAAGVIGNFERMVRIADGTGIPLDTVVNVGTETIRDELGIDDFAAAERTKSVTKGQRFLGQVTRPVIRRIMRFMARRRAD